MTYEYTTIRLLTGMKDPWPNVLSDMGREGWRLVTVITRREASRHEAIAFFEREIN